MFDPWKASFEEAKAESERRGYSADPTEPLPQWDAVQQINAKKEKIEAGEGFAVLTCVRYCLTNGLIAPDWLTYAYNRRYDAVCNFSAKSWDDPKAFGRPYPKGLNRAARKTRHLRQWQVWNMANELLQQGRSINADFFTEIGEKIKPPCEKTEVSDLYYKMKKFFESAYPQAFPQSSKNLRE